jgi:hypothetical protein
MDFERFELETIDYNNFEWEDIIGDGSCCFRSFANILNYYNNNLKINLHKETYEKLNNISDKNNDNYDYDDWGYDGIEQENIARILQEKSTKFILKNWNKRLDSLGYNTYGEFVKEMHNLKNEKKEYYQKIFSKFSGDDNDDEIDRWGSLAEIMALSEELKLPVNIYTPMRYIKKYKEIRMVKLTHKGEFPINTRIKIINKNGTQYNNKKEINLLYQYSIKGNHHYIPLYPKDNK